MAPISLAILALFAAPLALAHPVSVNNGTLLQNGQDAQTLNLEFMSLQKNSSCTDDQTACIGGQFASCSDKQWDIQACPGGRTCFALPNIRANGTFVACTSENNAASIIAATGATGGIVSPNASNTTVDFPLVGAANSTSSDDGDDDCEDGDDDDGKDGGSDDPDCEDGNDGGASHSSATKTKSATAPEATVTVTVTLPESGTVTKPPTTTTLQPAEASSILSSLVFGSASFVTVTPLPTASGAARNGALPSASIIFLNGPSSGAPAPTPAATSAAAPAGDGYSY
ncbi:hypothetical protein FA95DRAFT_1674526 [Auriscalpium vulgare]|uniref:Uncharacterized protein n=1 Tax=Auriscalpium vulgare TaxID=40419 RepID=A0ACB8SB32_9AGAM|nr:hypothetical protein FA95DRAFT_1674526 [Auriscalpium vulgare]